MAGEEIDFQDILLNKNDVPGAKLHTAFGEFRENRTKPYRNCAFSQNSRTWNFSILRSGRSKN